MLDNYNIRTATINDMKPIFELSNDESVRSNSINTSKISWDNHIEWFTQRIQSPECIFFVVESCTKQFIGQVRFDNHEEGWVVSISIMPSYRGMGITSSVLRKACDMANVDPLIAYIKESNVASLTIFENTGFLFERYVSFGNEYYRRYQKRNTVFFIAELSANHNHSLDVARKSIVAAAEAGADAIKIQTYTADTLTIDCNNDYFVIKGTSWNNMNLYKLYQQAYTPWEWHAELQAIAHSAGIKFFSTPFDAAAVDFLEELNVPMYKIASFEIVDIPLLRKVGATHKPVILSTGMATFEEIEEAISTLQQAGCPDITLLKCTSAYPASPKNMNLATILDMRQRFECRVGLSDHTIGTEASIAAVALGATVIEKHFILDQSMGGPDAHFSCEPEAFRKLVDSARIVKKAIGHPFYGCTLEEEKSKAFRRSLFVIKDIKKGELFTHDHVRSIRPGYGLPPKFLDVIIGRPATRDLSRGTPLQESDFQADASL
jgi:pseudaminic acid synthase